MKTKFLQFKIFTILLLTISGCSDDFLNKGNWDPDLLLEMTTESLLNQTGQQDIVFTIPGAGSSSYSIVQYPMWMNPMSLKGTTADDLLTLSFVLVDSSPQHTIYPDFKFGFEIENIGQVQVLVIFQEKLYSVIDVQPKVLDFGLEMHQLSITIINKGNKNVNIRIESYPNWIQPSGTSDYLLWPGEKSELSFDCKREEQVPGTLRDNIRLTCNGEILLIPVTMKVGENVQKIKTDIP